jgi:hypothetical protein
MIDVEILGQVITHQYGTLNTGDVLRTSPEFAKHLVEDCGAAKYRAAPEDQDAEPVQAQVTDADPAPAAKSRAKK